METIPPDNDIASQSMARSRCLSCCRLATAHIWAVDRRTGSETSHNDLLGSQVYRMQYKSNGSVFVEWAMERTSLNYFGILCRMPKVFATMFVFYYLSLYTLVAFIWIGE